jgi:uncharacterized tellurite resistance protein B-like protein
LTAAAGRQQGAGRGGNHARSHPSPAHRPAAQTQRAARSFEERQLAAAALMVEAATLDDSFDAAERARIAALVQRHFGLSRAEADDLVAEAERTASGSVELHGFTLAIKDGFDQAERVELIEMLWEVAYADGQLHDYEASLLRRIAGLLYVGDRESGEARKRVLARLGLQ